MTIAGTLRPVLGDQISDGRLSSLSDLDPARDVVLFAEVRAEATYVPHHRQKIALVFAGMRGFAERLRERGVRVRYVRLDDTGNTHTIAGEITRAAAAEGLRHVVMTEPGEWRLKEALDALALDPALRWTSGRTTASSVRMPLFAIGRGANRRCGWNSFTATCGKPPGC